MSGNKEQLTKIREQRRVLKKSLTMGLELSEGLLFG